MIPSQPLTNAKAVKENLGRILASKARICSGLDKGPFDGHFGPIASRRKVQLTLCKP
jgi:hypothetical protein